MSLLRVGIQKGYWKQQLTGLLCSFAAISWSMMLCAYGPAGYTGSDTDAPYSQRELQGIITSGPPRYSASSALLMDVDTQTLLWSDHAEQQRAPASLTKLMTALLLLNAPRQ